MSLSCHGKLFLVKREKGYLKQKKAWLTNFHHFNLSHTLFRLLPLVLNLQKNHTVKYTQHAEKHPLHSDPLIKKSHKYIRYEVQKALFNLSAEK